MRFYAIIWEPMRLPDETGARTVLNLPCESGDYLVTRRYKLRNMERTFVTIDFFDVNSQTFDDFALDVLSWAKIPPPYDPDAK